MKKMTIEKRRIIFRNILDKVIFLFFESVFSTEGIDRRSRYVKIILSKYCLSYKF